MEDRELKYFEYVTTYRSPAATGCGMGFAYWQLMSFAFLISTFHKLTSEYEKLDGA